MTSSNEAERLDTAEEYLLTYPAESQEFEAALEHVRWVHEHNADFRQRCEELLANVVRSRSDERRAMAKLRSLA
jgi:hypothetical protein